MVVHFQKHFRKVGFTPTSSSVSTPLGASPSSKFWVGDADESSSDEDELVCNSLTFSAAVTPHFYTYNHCILPQEKDISGSDNAAKKVSICKREKRGSTLLPVNNFGFDGLRFDEDNPFSSVSTVDNANNSKIWSPNVECLMR